MHKLRYMALGGLLMFIGMLMASVLMPSLVAQRDKFGEIECTKLTVVDGGDIFVWGEDLTSAVILGTRDTGGFIRVYGKDGPGTGVGIYGYEHGGGVNVYGKDRKSGVTLRVTEHGGHVQVDGKGDGSSVIAINEYGNGAVSTWDKNGYRQ